jgi:hypothetical protein
MHKQPMLVLLRTNGSTGKWRLNFNQQKIAEPTKSLSSEMPDSTLTEQWQCCFVPSDNTRGVEASIGEAPNWYSFVITPNPTDLFSRRTYFFNVARTRT